MRKLSIAIVAALAVAIGIPALGFAPAVMAQATLDITLMHPVEGRTFWYGGAGMPVVVLLTMDGNAVTDASATIWVNGVAGTGPGKAMDANNFMNLGDGLYQFNLETKPYPAGPGSAPIMVEVMASAGGMSASLEFNMILH